MTYCGETKRGKHAGGQLDRINQNNGAIVSAPEGSIEFLEHMSWLQEAAGTRYCYDFEGIKTNDELSFEKLVSILQDEFTGSEIMFLKNKSSESTRGHWVLVLKCDNFFIRFWAYSLGSLSLLVCSRVNNVNKIYERIDRILLPFRRSTESKDGVWVEFSMTSSHGIKRVPQFIRCPQWKDIENNYVDRTKSGLESVLSMEHPWDNGRLIILHGNPGTGKTYFLRSLFMKWRDKFNFVVLTDPEKFSANPEYYFELAGKMLLTGSEGSIEDMYDDDEIRKSENSSFKRTLFIMEDSADLIIEESRTTHYDKVSKLLNMTDGLFGQGRQDVFLVTFNEDVEKLDKAFLRPGRCIANVQFETFSATEAKKWLSDHGMNTIGCRMTIAELYAKLNNTGVIEAGTLQEKFGFSAKEESV